MLARVIEPDLTPTQLEALSPHERDVREQFYILGKDLVWGIWRRLVAGIGNGAVPAQYWGGSAEIQLVRLLFDVDILNYSATQKRLLWNGNGNSEDALVLYWRGLHYDWLMPTPQLQALISPVDLKLMANQPLPHVAAPELHQLYQQRLAAQQAEAASKQQPAAAEAAAIQQAEAAAIQQAEAAAKATEDARLAREAKAAEDARLAREAKEAKAAEAAAKQQAEELRAQLRAQQEKEMRAQEREMRALINDGQRIIGYLQQTLQDMPSANDIQRIITEARAGRAMRQRDGKRRKVSVIGENRAEGDLRRLNTTLTQAIDQAQRFWALIATQGIRQNPFFSSLQNTKNETEGKTIINAIRDLLSQLQRIKESLGVSKRGGSRKRRHIRRKTRRKKKNRKKKTIKRRRKRGRKTRRK